MELFSVVGLLLTALVIAAFRRELRRARSR